MDDGVWLIRIGEMIDSLTVVGFVKSVENIAHDNLLGFDQLGIGKFWVLLVFDQNEVMEFQCL